MTSDKRLRRKKFLRRGLVVSGVLLVLFLILVVYSNHLVIKKSGSSIYSQASEIPPAKVGLVLGTSRYVRGGGENLFFTYRMNAAVELFRSGKINHILVSGDNSVVEYNEPREMRRSLIEAGIPDTAITLDFAGFRTYDSVIRAKEVFGQDQVIIISQRFHLERAVFIALHSGITAVGFEAREVPGAYAPKTYLREYLAKFLAVLDVYILPTQPKFLGEKVPIEE